VVIPKLYNGRNRTFIFGNWEQWNYVRSSQSITSTPIASQRKGDFSQLLDSTGKLIPVYDPNTTAANPAGSGFVRDVFPGNNIPANRLDAVAQAYNQFYPQPNRAPTNAFTQVNNYIGTVNENRHMQQYTIRVDHRISAEDSLFGRYTYFVHHTDNGTSAPWPDPAVRDRFDNFETRNTAVSETHMFSPTVLNEFRVGTARQYFPFQAASFNQNWPQKLGFPSSVPATVIPTITSNGYTGFVTNTVGLRGALTWDFVDTVTVVRGKHAIKAGVEYRLLFGNNFQTSAPSGNFTFAAALTGNPQNQTGTGSAYADFLLGDASAASVTLNVGESEKGYSLSGFVQDDWRISRRLNLNLGLRYDYQQPPYERNNGTTNFDPYQQDPNYHVLGRVEYAGKDYARSFLNPDHKNFAPRIGFAYDVGANGKTVVRGGYAIYYPSIFNLNYFGNTQGFAATTTAYNPPNGNSNLPVLMLSQGFPTPPLQPQGRLLGPSYLLSQAVSYDQSVQRTPMSQQWDLAVQKELPGNWVVEVTYAGNHGTHLVAGSYDLNQLPTPYYAQGLALQNQVPNPYAGKVPGSLGGATTSLAQTLKAYPYYSGVTVRNPHLGNAIYHAGLLTVQKRFSQGLTLLASYTKAKLIDDSVQTPINFGNVEQTGITTYQNGLFNRRGERSLDPIDVSQRLVISGIYELPFGRNKPVRIMNPVLNAIAGGWQLQTIATFQVGLPTAISGANNNLASRPNSTGQSAKLDHPSIAEWFNTAAFVNPPQFTYGNLGRVLPDVRDPGVVNLDLSLSKNTSIKEKAKLQFRAEAFNFINHVNLGYPGVTFSPGANGLNVSSTFGVISSARDPRNVQLGMKLVF
jgi:hypothetical protein